MHTRFPGDPAPRVAVLQYGDEPMIEPGELLVRLTLEAAGGPDDQKQALRAFEQAHDGAIQRFWKDLRAQLPEAWRLEVRTSGDTGHGPRIMLGARRQDGSLEARAAEGQLRPHPGHDPDGPGRPGNPRRPDHQRHLLAPGQARRLTPISPDRQPESDPVPGTPHPLSSPT